MKANSSRLLQLLRMLLLMTMSILVASCAVPQVVQPSARGLPLPQVAVITTPPVRYRDILYAAVDSIIDAQGKKVVSFGITANMHNTVVVVPGTYDIRLHCFNDTASITADPSAKVEFRAGFTYLLHCLVEYGSVSVHMDAVETKTSS